MGNIDIKTLLEGNTIFEEFKGTITEQFVLQQMLYTKNFDIFYWSDERSNAEIDFLIQHKGNAIPVKVKAEENLQAKNLKVFCQKYNPEISIRISMSDFHKQTNISLLKTMVY